MTKPILITGSNGLLGQKLVTLFQENNIPFWATSRGENRLSNLSDKNFISLDIQNAKEIEDVFEKIDIFAVIHTAAMTQVDDCENQKNLCIDLNVNATLYLAEICAKKDIFFVHLSTDFIFDGKEGPYTEEAQPNPLSFYGESKYFSEKVLQHTPKLRYAIARTVLVYGIAEAMSRSNIILWVRKSLMEGKTIQVVNDQWRTPTLAEDLAMGCYLLATHQKTGIFNISGIELLTPFDMAVATADFFGLDKSLIEETDGSKFQQTAQRPPRTGFILDKAMNQIGYKPHAFVEGLEILKKQLG
jgi:dTDP-4-dehydrorhamnose reductase